MNKSIAIVTLYANNNFGNKLQNYAVQEVIKKSFGYDTYTIINYYEKYKLIKVFKDSLKKLIRYKNFEPLDIEREKKFREFDKNINKSPSEVSYRYPKSKLNNMYDYFIVGSDQVWNQTTGRISQLFLLSFVNNSAKKISFSASLGTDNLLEESKNQVKKYISDFDNISVREVTAKKIIEDLTERNDVEVLIDPTMSLTTDDWNKVCKKPSQIDAPSYENKKYILLYFLGKYAGERKDAIERFASENDCKIINILDKSDEFYKCGPAEFIWLEKNAFMVCTDSFHSSVFAILYKRPFIVFNRDDGQRGVNEMNSRIDTLLSKFKLEGNYYNGKISNDIINKNYDYTEDILEEERNKTINFLKKAFKIQNEEIKKK